MFNTVLKFRKLIVLLAGFFLLIAIGASTLDFHEGVKLQDNCPLCQFQLYGNATEITFEPAIPALFKNTFLFYSFTFEIKRLSVFLESIRPHAPPIA